jgi:hypothetical protein
MKHRKSSKIRKLSFGAAAMLGALILAGCENGAHIYPANAQAESLGGEMGAHFTPSGEGHGTIEAIGPAGELLRGDYAPAPADYKFGDVFKAVYGEYSTLPTAADKGTPTVAALNGTKGTSMQCEFYNNEDTGNGFGGCKTLTGALYRIQY